MFRHVPVALAVSLAAPVAAAPLSPDATFDVAGTVELGFDAPPDSGGAPDVVRFEGTADGALTDPDPGAVRDRVLSAEVSFGGETVIDGEQTVTTSLLDVLATPPFDQVLSDFEQAAETGGVLAIDRVVDGVEADFDATFSDLTVGVSFAADFSLELTGEGLGDLTLPEPFPPLSVADLPPVEGPVPFEVALTVASERGGSSPAPVPIPAALPMLAAGLAGLALFRRRRG